MKNFSKYALTFLSGTIFASVLIILLQYYEYKNPAKHLKRNWVQIKSGQYDVGGWYDWEWHTIINGDTIIVKTANYAQ